MNFETPDINKIRKELDEKNAEMEKKERERMEEEYKRSSEQVKSTEEPIEEKLVEEKKEKPEEKEKPSAAAYSAEAAASAAKTGKAMEGKEEEDLEKEITERYYDELEKIKKMPNNTGELKKEKTEKYFELIDSWKDLSYLDDYKGIKKIFSELDKLEPSIFLYDLKKAQTVNKIGLTMALNYKEWDLEDKEKLKIIKNFVNKQSKEKSIFYSKDKTFKEIARILASEDVPFKGNIDIIVKNIEDPDIKSETIAKILEIEKESIEKKKQFLQDIKEDIKRDKLPPDEIIIEQLEKFGFDKEEAFKVLPELVKFFEDPETKEKIQELIKTKQFQELKDMVEKITKETKEKGEIPESVAKAKEHIEKKESRWGTIFGAAGWGILLFLVLFLLAELKGVDWLSGQAGGKKK